MQRLKSILPAELQSLDPKAVTHQYCLELIRTPIVELSRLQYLANYLTPENWTQVSEERSIDNVCGWPMCEVSTEWTTQKPAQVLAPGARNGLQILDRSELFCFCGADHMSLSKQVEASLNPEPWWMQASRTRPIDLAWLSVVIGLLDFNDDMDVDSDSTAQHTTDGASSNMHDVSTFTIRERDDEVGLAVPLARTKLEPNSLTSSSIEILSNGIGALDSFDYSAGRVDSPSIASDRSRSPAIGMDISTQPSESDDSDYDESDDEADNFFNGNFKKQKLDMTMTPNMQILNTMIHWVTPKTQRFCTQPDYKPHLHTVTLHVAAQSEDTMPNEAEEEAPELRRPAVDGLDIETNKRSVITQFVTTRLTSFCNSAPELDRTGILRTLAVMFSTFDLTMPLEALKTQQWNIITITLVSSIVLRHPGLQDVLDRNRSTLESNFNIDFKFVQELLNMFVYRN